jgi:uncharacterized protein YwqG
MQVIDSLAIGRVKEFLKENLRFATVLVPDSPPPPALPSEEEMIEAFKNLPISEEQKDAIIKQNIALRNYLTTRDDDASLPNITFSHLSKIGGLPIAPANFVFPTNAQGLSAIFLAQIHLAEFKQYFEAPKELKGDGILYFFATIRIDVKSDITHFDGIKAVYSTQTDDLIQLALPADLARFGTLQESHLRVAEIIDFPYMDSVLWQHGAKTREIIANFHQVSEVLKELQNYQGLKFWGNAEQIQGCILTEAEMCATNTGYFSDKKLSEELIDEAIRQAEPQAIRWRHLCALDLGRLEFFSNLTHFEGKFSEYVEGCLYTLITQEDLENMNFENIVNVYQMS